MGRSARGRARTAVAGRDRVLDAARAFALGVVVLAHALAWDVGTGVPANVLDRRPDVAWLTWLLQVLPLFFAAGGIANATSWRREPDVAAFWRRRLLRLSTPALLYTSVWTAVLLPLAVVVPLAEPAGRFAAQLVWFLGVYAAVVVAAPWTVRWTARPWPTLAAWLVTVLAVDLLRWNVDPALGWLNLLLVWGFAHQLGYHLPALRTAPRLRLLLGAVVAATTAVALGVLGPYSAVLVSYVGDPEPSNLSPPTLVVALYAVAQVLGLAALWPWLDRRLAADRLYLAVGAFGARGIGIYLWHIPIVALVAGVAWWLGFDAAPLGAAWWAAHLLGVAVVLAGAWWLAGRAQAAERRALARVSGWRAWRVPLAPVAVAVPLVLLSVSTTGFGTWWGAGMLGLPSSSLLDLALLAAAWRVLATSAAPA